MKINEIKKIGEEISMQSEELEFFKNLYKHCMTAVELVPEEFIRNVFEQAHSKKSEVDTIGVFQDSKSGNTRVDFYWLDPEGGYTDFETYIIEAPRFDFRKFTMFIYLTDRAFENSVQFSWDSNAIRFSCQDAKRVFGKYLVKLDESMDTCDVSTSCFD